MSNKTITSGNIQFDVFDRYVHPPDYVGLREETLRAMTTLSDGRKFAVTQPVPRDWRDKELTFYNIVGGMLEKAVARKEESMSNLSKIRVIAFDLFNTVFDPATANPNDTAGYVEALRAWRERGEYIPVKKVESFAKLRTFPDSLPGLEALQGYGYRVVAASNIPAFYVHKMTRFASEGLFEWDHVMEFSDLKKYKPSLACYAAICDEMKCLPNEVLFVTGNHGARSIGDDIEPLKIGMQVEKIRNGAVVENVAALASVMEYTKGRK